MRFALVLLLALSSQVTLANSGNVLVLPDSEADADYATLDSQQQTAAGFLVGLSLGSTLIISSFFTTTAVMTLCTPIFCFVWCSNKIFRRWRRPHGVPS